MPISPELRQQLREKARVVAEKMPPFTQEQVTRLRVLLGGGR